MQIAIGSTSKYKIEALELACQGMQIACEIIPVQIAIKKRNRQPVGFEQTLQYAKDRAEFARREWPETMCIGIESGIMRAQDVTIDLAVIAALTPDWEWYFGTSPGIRLPERHVLEAERRRGGFKTTTVGQVIAEALHGDPADPHASLTRGAVKRQYFLFSGVYTLFLQLRTLGLL